MEKLEKPFNPEQLANILYTHYCYRVGGKAWNGDPLPDWATFRADPYKERQADAWVAVATKALDLLA